MTTSNYQKNHSNYYQILVDKYGTTEADKIWKQRSSNSVNYQELNDKLTKYLKIKQ